MKIACFQPYFIPYLNYFRLFAHTDLFVILDNVQHIRRGFEHRNKLPNRQGRLDWLTLPIKSCPRDTLIKDLKFADNANQVWAKQLKKFPLFDNDTWPLYGTPCVYIIKHLQAICDTLEIPFNTVRSSEIDIPPALKGQDRILALCEHFGATEYINSPGGKELYSEDAFRLYGMKLTFLPDYKNKKSILERIVSEDVKKLRGEIYAGI